MVAVLKLSRSGNSVGAVFPRSVLEELHVGAGDKLFLTRTADGLRLTPYDPEFERQMEKAREIGKRRRNVYRELARR